MRAFLYVLPGLRLDIHGLCGMMMKNNNTPRGYISEGKTMSEKNSESREILEEAVFCPACSERRKKRTPEEQKALIKRLRLAEGQIRGIQKMVENDAYCPDILIQVSAVTSALNSFNKELLACHIHSCVSEDIRAGRDEAVDELVKVMQRLMK